MAIKLTYPITDGFADGYGRILLRDGDTENVFRAVLDLPLSFAVAITPMANGMVRLVANDNGEINDPGRVVPMAELADYLALDVADYLADWARMAHEHYRNIINIRIQEHGLSDTDIPLATVVQ